MLEDFNNRRFVSTALRRSREACEAFRNPLPVDVNSTTGASPTGKVSVALAGLVGSAPGSGASTRPGATSGGRSATNRTRVEITDVLPLPLSGADLETGRQTTRVTMTVSGAKAAVPVSASALSVAVDGGVMASEGQVVLEQWVLADGSAMQTNEAVVVPGQRISADISYPTGLAIEFNFSVGQL